MFSRAVPLGAAPDASARARACLLPLGIGDRVYPTRVGQSWRPSCGWLRQSRTSPRVVWTRLAERGSTHSPLGETKRRILYAQTASLPRARRSSRYRRQPLPPVPWPAPPTPQRRSSTRRRPKRSRTSARLTWPRRVAYPRPPGSSSPKGRTVPLGRPPRAGTTGKPVARGSYSIQKGNVSGAIEFDGITGPQQAAVNVAPATSSLLIREPAPVRMPAARPS